MRVFVYFNLHRKCWSVKALDGVHKGRVVDHVNSIYLKDVTFRVSESGRQRVLREKRKNVHAGVVGTRVHEDPPAHQDRVRYNPYRGASFVDDEGCSVVAAASAVLINGAVYTDGLVHA